MGRSMKFALVAALVVVSIAAAGCGGTSHAGISLATGAAGHNQAIPLTLRTRCTARALHSGSEEKGSQ